MFPPDCALDGNGWELLNGMCPRDVCDCHLSEQPSVWSSDFIPGDDGYRIMMIEPNAFTSCWKLDNEFNDTMEGKFKCNMILYLMEYIDYKYC